MELGHECVLSETNDGGFVPLCKCGWIGTVHPFFGMRDGETLRKSERRRFTMENARDEHAEHCHLVREAIAAEHALAMTSHAAYVQTVAPTVRRIGRWGRG